MLPTGFEPVSLATSNLCRHLVFPSTLFVIRQKGLREAKMIGHYTTGAYFLLIAGS